MFLVLHSVFPKRIAMCGYTSLNLPLFLLELWVVACEHLIFQLVVEVEAVPCLCDLSGGGIMALM